MDSTNRDPVLITAILIRYLKIATKISETFCFFPTKWDDRKNVPVNRRNKVVYHAKAVLMFAFAAYVFVRAALTDWTSMAFSKQVHAAVILVIYFFVPLVEYVHLQISVSWSGHVRRAIGFSRVLEATILAEQVKPSRLVKYAETAALMGILSMPFNCLFFAIHPLVMRESPESLYPVLSYLIGGNSSALNEMWIALLMFPIQFYVTANMGCLGIACMITMIFDILTLEAGLAYLGSKRYVENVLFSVSYKAWTDRIQLYSNLFLIVGGMGKMYWMLSAAAQYIIMVFATLGIFTMVRIGGFLGFMVGAVGTMSASILLVTFNHVAKFPMDSQKILDTWKRQGELVPLDLRKRIKALTPLKYRFGNLYFVDKMLLLTICKITVENTIVMLMTN